MPKDKTYKGAMREKIIRLLESGGKNFKVAFMEVAHKYEIYHGDERGSYNYHFRDMKKRVKAYFKRKGIDFTLEMIIPVQCPSPPTKNVQQKKFSDWEDYGKLAANDRD